MNATRTVNESDRIAALEATVYGPPGHDDGGLVGEIRELRATVRDQTRIIAGGAITMAGGLVALSAVVATKL